MIKEPMPRLQTILEMIGDAGLRMTEIDACEGAAGNISVFLRWEVDVQDSFPLQGKIDLPQPVPEFAGATLIVSGSGRRLRDIGKQPAANVACLLIDPGGRTAQIWTATDSLVKHVTSEFNSHLAVHYERAVSSGTNFHAIIHVQPPYLTFLSHIPKYQDPRYLNEHLLRWQPETILNLPEGIGVAPFIVPGSDELAAVTAGLFRRHHVVIWSRHGVMACSDISVKRASDRIEYAEASARYEYMNLSCGEAGDGLSAEEIRLICATKNVQQSYF